jgi:hypothetical protein
VTNSGTTGTLTIGGTATNPSIDINFPASSGGTGFTWSTAGPNSTDSGPDIINPLNWTNSVGPGAANGPQGGYAFVPTACSVKSLFVAGINVTDPGYTGADTVTVVVQHNGTSTSMSCAVAIANGQSTSTTTCLTTSHTFSVAVGDTLSYSVTQTNSNPYEQLGTTLVCE